MEGMMKANQKALLLEFCEQLAMEGLRTLVFAQKVLTEEESEKFMTTYNQALNTMSHREQKIQLALKQIELDMNFIGVSGVEDKLQKNVQTTIDSLKGAGIQVWMLTGDRVETGVSIAISAGLKAKSNELYFITEHVNPSEVSLKLNDFRKRAKKTILIIDGRTLDTILDSEELKFQFFDVAMLAPCLCVCRCSPT